MKHILLAVFAFLTIALSAQEKQKIYVWDFVSENISDPDFVILVTDDFETILQSAKKYNVLERREFAKVLAQNQNEKAVQSLNDLQSGTKVQLASMKAELVVFGKLTKTATGKYKLSVKFQNISTTEIENAGADYFIISDFEDDSKRLELFRSFVSRLENGN
ncbi:MAG: hypothetical protein AB9834_22665 [Lentimicrobium sp.]